MPWDVFLNKINDWPYSPTGAINNPFRDNCSNNGGGTFLQAAVMIILSKGDSSGIPKLPSPKITSTL